MVNNKHRSTRIVLQVPNGLLSEFDLGISGHFVSRTEAIRHAMTLLLDIHGWRKAES